MHDADRDHFGIGGSAYVTVACATRSLLDLRSTVATERRRPRRNSVAVAITSTGGTREKVNVEVRRRGARHDGTRLREREEVRCGVRECHHGGARDRAACTEELRAKRHAQHQVALPNRLDRGERSPVRKPRVHQRADLLFGHPRHARIVAFMCRSHVAGANADGVTETRRNPPKPAETRRNPPKPA